MRAMTKGSSTLVEFVSVMVLTRDKVSIWRLATVAEAVDAAMEAEPEVDGFNASAIGSSICWRKSARAPFRVSARFRNMITAACFSEMLAFFHIFIRACAIL